MVDYLCSPEIASAFALRIGLESYDSLPEAWDFVTSSLPAAPPIVNSAMPTPVQTGAPLAVFLRLGSSVTSAMPMPSLSSMDTRTVPSESTIAERPGKKPLISFGGGLYERPTLFTIATGMPRFFAYHDASRVPGPSTSSARRS